MSRKRTRRNRPRNFAARMNSVHRPRQSGRSRPTGPPMRSRCHIAAPCRPSKRVLAGSSAARAGRLRKADAVDLDALAAQVQRDVVPALHSRRDCLDSVGVVRAEEFQRLLGAHHAETPGRSGGVLLEQIDLRVRVTLLPEITEIEAAGASADHGDTQDATLPYSRGSTPASQSVRLEHSTALYPGEIKPGAACLGLRSRCTEFLLTFPFQQ